MWGIAGVTQSPKNSSPCRTGEVLLQKNNCVTSSNQTKKKYHWDEFKNYPCNLNRNRSLLESGNTLVQRVFSPRQESQEQQLLLDYAFKCNSILQHLHSIKPRLSTFPIQITTLMWKELQVGMFSFLYTNTTPLAVIFFTKQKAQINQPKSEKKKSLGTVQFCHFWFSVSASLLSCYIGTEEKSMALLYVPSIFGSSRAVRYNKIVVVQKLNLWKL